MPDGLGVLTDQFNVSAPGANTNILSTGLTPAYSGTLHISVCLATASVLNITESDGTTTFTIGLNASVALNAGDGYTFSWGCIRNRTYNFQVETDGVIRKLQVNLSMTE